MSKVHYFAADVSKRELVIAAYPGAGEVVPVPNTAAAITAVSYTHLTLPTN